MKIPIITNKWLTGFLLLTFILATSLHVQAQERGIEDIVLEGIQFHDEGRYDDAIRRYHTAFAIDSTSSLVHYQIAYAWFMKRDFEKVLHHGREALKYAPDDDSYALAVNLTGAAMDNSGNVEGAVQIYEEAIDRVPDLHLLHYNLGVSAQKLEDFNRAETAYINSIYLNSDHASSHLQLGLLHSGLGNKVQSLYPLLYFLLIEPDTHRSAFVLDEINRLLGLDPDTGSDVDKTGSRTITIPSSTFETGFSTIELMLSLSGAMRNALDEVAGDDRPAFDRQLSMILKMANDLSSENEGLWWEFYVPLFGEISDSSYFELFCNYIQFSRGESERLDWLHEREEELDEFFNWLVTLWEEE